MDRQGQKMNKILTDRHGQTLKKIVFMYKHIEQDTGTKTDKNKNYFYGQR